MDLPTLIHVDNGEEHVAFFWDDVLFLTSHPALVDSRRTSMKGFCFMSIHFKPGGEKTFAMNVEEEKFITLCKQFEQARVDTKMEKRRQQNAQDREGGEGRD